MDERCDSASAPRPRLRAHARRHRVRDGGAFSKPTWSLLLVCSVWSLLGAGRLLVAPLGRGGAILAAFLAATALVLAARRSSHEGASTHGRASAEYWRSLSLGWLAGLCCHPALTTGIAALGLGIGLAPAPARLGAPPGVLLVLSVGILAPVFEELLYRDILLRSLRPGLGSVGAVFVSSALFALSHVDTWAVLGTWVAGLLLGTLALCAREVTPCIGAHAGLNLAGLAAPLPSAFTMGYSKQVACLLCAGVIAAALAVALSPGDSARTDRSAGARP